MKKKLYRNTKNKMLGGVCSGIADYLGIDATVIRLIWAILTVCTFSTLLLIYLLCWIIIPADDNIIDN